MRVKNRGIQIFRLQMIFYLYRVYYRNHGLSYTASNLWVRRHRGFRLAELSQIYIAPTLNLPLLWKVASFSDKQRQPYVILLLLSWKFSMNWLKIKLSKSFIKILWPNFRHCWSFQKCSRKDSKLGHVTLPKGHFASKTTPFQPRKFLTWPKMRHLFTKASLDLKKEPIGLKGVTWRIRHFANAYAEKIWTLLWPNYAFFTKWRFFGQVTNFRSWKELIHVTKWGILILFNKKIINKNLLTQFLS